MKVVLRTLCRARRGRRDLALTLAASAVGLSIGVASVSPAGAATGRIRRGDPLAARPGFVQPGSAAAGAVAAYRRQGRAGEARLMQMIAAQPQAIWLTGGSWDLPTLESTLSQARTARQLPTYVLYDIPHRDCGAYSSGGAPNAAAYRRWVRQIASRLGRTPAAVIIEPDALAEASCWRPRLRLTLIRLVRWAALTVAARPHTTVYLDAGNSDWDPAWLIAKRLRMAGVKRVRGFALNVSNFQTTGRSIRYGKAIDRGIGRRAHFVIDTSRNGRGPRIWPNGQTEWCNPPGRGLGHAPTWRTHRRLVDAYLWVHPPGFSDGSCHRSPPSGSWWPAYALGLARRARLG